MHTGADARSLAAGAVAAPAKHERTWLYAVVGALLAIMGGGAWMLTRHQELPGLGAQSAVPPAAMPSIEAIAAPPQVTKPVVAPVETAVSRTPAPAAPAPAGTAPVVPPPPTPVAGTTPSTAPDSATWKALSRSQKAKPTSAHRRARPRPATAEAANGDDKEKAAATTEAQKADPFAD